MKAIEKAENNFKRDTKDHKMTVECDNGLNRSLLFSDGSSQYHFRINTWFDHLCISGDMGTFVFKRLDDMFDFFRNNKVNPEYWAEKAMAQNIWNGGILEGRSFTPQYLWCCHAIVWAIGEYDKFKDMEKQA